MNRILINDGQKNYQCIYRNNFKTHSFYHVISDSFFVSSLPSQETTEDSKFRCFLK